MIQERRRGSVDPRPAISACVITRDESDRIGDCLASVNFCDERLVVDSCSRDGTQERARECGATVVEQQWMGYIAQKEFATRAARHEWVLCIDADERVSDALRDEIVQLQAEGFRDAVGYQMARLSRYRGRWIRHGSWYPNRQLRLFDRRTGYWGGLNPHDRVIVAGPVGKLRSDLLHFPYRSGRHQLRKIDEYTAIAARELLKRDCRFVVLRLVFNPSFRVVRSLLLKLGLLDGRRGVALAFLEARYAYLKYWKLLQLRRQAREGQLAQHEALGEHRFVSAGSGRLCMRVKGKPA